MITQEQKINFIADNIAGCYDNVISSAYKLVFDNMFSKEFD